MSKPSHAGDVVIDASVMVDLLARTSDRYDAVRARLPGTVMHAPAHFDAEVLSALGRMQRAGVLSTAEVGDALDELASAPVNRHGLTPLLTGAWSRRDTLRLTDALYVELAETAGFTLLTTDHRLARAWPPAHAID